MPKPVLLRLVSVAAPLLLAASVATAQQKVGPWDVGPSYADRTGEFSFCLMNSTYQDRTSVGVMMTPQEAWGLLFSHPRWQLREGQSITATVTVDGTTVARGSAKIMGERLILLPLAGGNAFGALQGGHGMRVTTSIGRIGNELPFSLRGTRAAMEAVVDCVRQYRGTTRAPARPSAPPATSNNRQSPVPAAEAMAMINNMLAKAGVSGHEFDKPSGNTVTWRLPDGTRGAFFAFRNWNAPIEQAVANVTEVARKECKGGDLGTIERSVPTSDGSLVRHVAIACRGGAVTTDMNWTLVRKLDGLLMCFTHSGGTPGAGAGSGEGSRPNQLNDRVLQGVLRM